MIEIPLPVLDQGRERLLQRVGGHHGLDGAAEIERVVRVPVGFGQIRMLAGTKRHLHRVVLRAISRPHGWHLQQQPQCHDRDGTPSPQRHEEGAPMRAPVAGRYCEHWFSSCPSSGSERRPRALHGLRNCGQGSTLSSASLQWAVRNPRAIHADPESSCDQIPGTSSAGAGWRTPPARHHSWCTSGDAAAGTWRGKRCDDRHRSSVARSWCVR
ncbi:hypothetical protein G6F22_017375 [Rhizopus arrhizus]|nr:hypothetical protein G6F22_017375 [Rhizopus arrhizus]